METGIASNKKIFQSVNFVKEKIVNCPYCNSNCKLKFKSLNHPDWKQMTNVDMYECLQCKSLTTCPMPSKKKLTLCYSQYVKGFPERKSVAKENSNQRAWYRKVLALLNLKFLKNKKIADVGAGEGLFTEELLKICKNCTIDCFDFHDVPKNLKNLQLHNQNSLHWTKADVTEEYWIKKEKYDIIICNAVLEHVIEPRILVDNLYSICKKGGTIFILAPCLDALAYKILQKKWPYIIPGEHLSIPSFKGLNSLIGNYQVSEYHIKKIKPAYSLNYVLGTLLKIKLPNFLDFSISVPTGSFLLEIRKLD